MIPTVHRNTLNSLVEVINQMHDMARKIRKIQETNSLHRNFLRIKELLEHSLDINGGGLLWLDPLGEKYDLTRTDCEANLSGSGVENLVITDVIKPIIYLKKDGQRTLVQRGVVVVQST